MAIIRHDPNSDNLRDLVLGYCEKRVEEQLRKEGKWNDEKEAKYVIYARRSSESEDRQERSIPDQISDCQKLCEINGIKPYKIIPESKSAKVSGQRPFYNEMIEGIKKGKWNSIIAWHPNRLARNMLEAGEIIDLLDRGLIKNLIFKNYVFNHNSNGLLMLGIEFIMAKQYSDNLSEVVNRGNHKIADEGKSPNMAPKRGYIIGEGRYFRPDGDNFAMLRAMLKEIADNKLTLDEAAAILNRKKFEFKGKITIITKQKLSEICADPFYCGFYIYGGKKIVELRNTDPKFIPMLTYQKFLQIRSRFRPDQKRFQIKNTQFKLMRGMVHCGYSKNHTLMTPGVSGGSTQKYLYLRCADRDCECRKVLGKANQVRGKMIIDFLLELTRDVELNDEAYKRYLEGGQEMIANRLQEIQNTTLNYQRLIKENEQKIDQLTQALIKINPANQKQIDKVNKEMKDLDDENDGYKEQVEGMKGEKETLLVGKTANQLSKEDFLNLMKNIGNIAKNTESVELLDEIIRLVFLNLTIKEGKVAIYQLNPLFESMLKPTSVLLSRNDRTRTCDLTHPMRAF